MQVQSPREGIFGRIYGVPEELGSGTRRRLEGSEGVWVLVGAVESGGRGVQFMLLGLGVPAVRRLRVQVCAMASSAPSPMHKGGGPCFAGVDCGTNSTRLLVLDAQGKTLAREMQITRLGQGVDATGRLADEAIGRVCACLEEYRRILESHDPDAVREGRIRASATSAARDAENSAEFFARAEAALGARPELLPGAEEGRLSFLGATDALPVSDGMTQGEQATIAVVDLGGGSTEVCVGSRSRVDALKVVSCQMGSVRLAERFLWETDPPSKDALDAAAGAVRQVLQEAAPKLEGISDASLLVGVAGTVSATTRLVKKLEGEYDKDKIHHSVLHLDQIEATLADLAGKTHAERIATVGMEAKRADVILGGLVTLVELMKFFKFDRLLTSENDILDGLAASVLEKHK